MAEPSLREFLRRVRHRILVVGSTASFCWALTAIGLVLLIGIWLDLLWDLPPAWRLAATLCALTAGATLLAGLLARTWRSARNARAARQLDQAIQGGGVIVSGWELADAAGGSVASPPTSLTAGLARIAVEHARQLAAAVPASQAVSPRPARNAAGMLGGLLVATAAATLGLPHLAGTELNRFLNPFADVPPYSAVRFAVEPGDTSVLYGADLELHVTVTSGSADRVELVVEGASPEPDVLPMFPESGHQWRTTLTRVTQPGTYFVRADRARSTRYQIDVITVPQIETVRFRVTPPAYTNQPAWEGPLPKNGLSGLPGTGVQVWVKSNRPLRGGLLDLHLAENRIPIELHPAAEPSDEVSGGFTLESGGKFELTVTDVEGQSSQESFGGGLTLLEDQRPFVRMLAPRPMSLATPTANLPVVVAAEDDYGVARIQLFRSLNHSRPLPCDVQLETPSPRHWQWQTQLPLADYGLTAGDEIKLFARVEDNDPAGAKGAESQVVTVRIISQAEFERMLRQREGLDALISKYQAAQRRLERLRERIDERSKELADADPESAASESLQDALRELIDELRESARQIGESAEHPLPYDADRELAEQLKRLADQLSDGAESLEALAGRPALSNQEALDELRDLAARLGEGNQQFQQEAMLPLEHLARVYRLLQDQGRFVALARRQRDLSDRLASLQGHDDDQDPVRRARMRELEEEQGVLRGELSDLLDDIEDHANQLPDEPRYDRLRETATQFAAAVRVSGASEAMSAGEAGLAEFSGTRGYEQATRAAEILESFLGQCDGMGEAGEGCLAFHPTLGNCLAQTAQQLLAEAGLGTGAGPGAGVGSGYSARRGLTDNVGLYGGLPGMDGMAGDGAQGDDFRHGSGGTFGSPGGADQPVLFHSDTHDGATGASEAMIPPGYRRRVGEYFLRIAEETGDE